MAAPDLTQSAALISALGIIAMLVKAMLERRRQKNGHGMFTREEFTGALAGLGAQIKSEAARLDEKIGNIKDEILRKRTRIDDVEELRPYLHQLRSDMNTALVQPMTEIRDLANRLTRVETVMEIQHRRPG